jgi:hypothetical protein
VDTGPFTVPRQQEDRLALTNPDARGRGSPRLAVLYITSFMVFLPLESSQTDDGQYQKPLRRPPDSFETRNAKLSSAKAPKIIPLSMRRDAGTKMRSKINVRVIIIALDLEDMESPILNSD